MTDADKITTINPSTGQVLEQYDVMQKDDVDAKVDKAKQEFKEWKKDYEKRRNIVYALVSRLRKNKSKLAQIATTEMGKPIRESESEVEKCAWAMEYYADHGNSFISEEPINTDARKSIVSFEPLGVIGSIMPWNFPYWQAMRFVAPCIMSGNTIVMKPASVTTQCGLAMEQLFLDSGFPEGVFQVVVGNYTTANHLIDSKTSAVTFTGSTNAGAAVGQRSAGNLKKCVLELGGSDPFIVCDDADVKKAAEGAVKGRFINCGQSCIASKRFIVPDDLYDEFVHLFVEGVSNLKVGDPMNHDTDVGPLVNKAGMDTISSIIDDAVSKGASIQIGGSKIDSDGFYYSPTILSDITGNMKIASEETFGPVAPITKVHDIREAIKIANDTEFGLGASIWTHNLENAEKISKQIQAGIVSVNNVVVSDPRVPFGGTKHSGFGRELSKYGMLEFVNIKSIRFYDDLVHHHFVE